MEQQLQQLQVIDKNTLTPLPITEESYSVAMKEDNSGRAWALYCLYVRCCLHSDTSQPMATDEWCASKLSWNIKVVRKYRQILARCGLIIHIPKQASRYVRVNYLTVKLSNKKSFTLSESNVPDGVIGTYAMLGYFTLWYDRMIAFRWGLLDARIIKRSKDHHGYRPVSILDREEVLSLMEDVWRLINNNGWGIMSVRNELSFFYYVLDAVIHKLISKKALKKIAAERSEAI